METKQSRKRDSVLKSGRLGAEPNAQKRLFAVGPGLAKAIPQAPATGAALRPTPQRSTAQTPRQVDHMTTGMFPSFARLSFTGLALLCLGCGGSKSGSIESYSLQATANSLGAGEKVTIQAVVVGTSPFSSFLIESGTSAGTLSVANGSATFFNASKDVLSETEVVIRGTSTVDASKTATVTLKVFPNGISEVVVFAGKDAIEPEQSVNLTAAVSGFGIFTRDISWTIVSGGGELSPSVGAMVTYKANGVPAGTTVEIRATSADMVTKKFGTAVLKVTQKPVLSMLTVMPTTVPGGGGTVTLSWNALYADGIEIQPDIGTVTGVSKTVEVTKDTDFIVTAKNGLGVDSKTASVKVQNGGEQAWLRQLDMKGGWYFEDTLVAGDRDGNLFVAKKASKWICVLAKYGADGSPLFQKTLFDTSLVVGLRSMVVDQSGSVYIGGDRRSDAGEGNPTIIADAIVSKVDTAGNLVWSKAIGTSESADSVLAMALDGSGGLRVLGATSDNTSTSFWTTRIDAQGTMAPIQSLPEVLPVESYRTYAKIDQDGNLYLAGLTLKPVFELPVKGTGYNAWVAKYDFAGNRKWGRIINSTADAFIYNVNFDAQGNLYASGSTSGSIEGAILSGPSDAWIAKYGSAGTLSFVKQFGSVPTTRPERSLSTPMVLFLSVDNQVHFSQVRLETIKGP